MEQIHNKKKRMPTILNEEQAGEWISDGLSEERIIKLATYQIPSDKIEFYTLPKDFKTALDPTERFDYSNLPELVLQ